MTKVKAIFFALVMICGTLAGCTHDSSPPDTDGDGVEDSIDLCPGTPANENVDAALSHLPSALLAQQFSSPHTTGV